MTRATARGARLRRATRPNAFDALRRWSPQSGAHAAALVDHEGEAVDYTGRLEPFDIKVAAAHLQILLAQAERTPTFAGVRSLVVRAARRSFLVAALAQGYALVVVLARHAGNRSAARALEVAFHAIASEAGWQVPPASCVRVGVTTDARGRPTTVWLEGAPEPAEILGTVGGRSRRPAAFRVRLGSGAEITVVREAPGAWFADRDGVRAP